MKITLPIFLGKDPEPESYFFFARNEQGLGQFIKYGNRRVAFWCGTVNMSDLLVLGEVPETIYNEVIELVDGKSEVNIKLTHPKKRRSEKTEISILEEVTGNLNGNYYIPGKTKASQEAQRRGGTETAGSKRSGVGQLQAKKETEKTGPADKDGIIKTT